MCDRRLQDLNNKTLVLDVYKFIYILLIKFYY